MRQAPSMILRRTMARHRRSVAVLGLLAMLLAALMPTVSQVRASFAHAHVSRADSGADREHREHHAAHDGHCGDPDDGWAKCRYCGFFAHMPAVAVPSHWAAAIAPAAQAIVAPLRGTVTPIRRFDAARPRGPPSLA